MNITALIQEAKTPYIGSRVLNERLEGFFEVQSVYDGLEAA